jgi:hypothetical protein
MKKLYVKVPSISDVYCHIICVTVDGVWNIEWVY